MEKKIFCYIFSLFGGGLIDKEKMINMICKDRLYQFDKNKKKNVFNGAKKKNFI